MPVGVGIGTSVIGGLSAAGANRASKKATQAAVAENEKTRAIAQPFVDNGRAALDTLSDPNRMMAAFQTDPGYQFRMQQGMEAVNQNKAVQGLLRSGSTIKDSIGFGQGLASSEYDKVYNRLFDRAQLGMQGVGVVGGVNTNNAQANMQHGTNAGNAMLAVGNSVASGLGSIARGFPQTPPPTTSSFHSIPIPAAR